MCPERNIRHLGKIYRKGDIMEQSIDAKGLACPKPVILAKKAMDTCSRGDVVLITVDNEMAVENLRKLAGSQKAEYASTKLGEKEFSVRITVTRENENQAETEIPVNCSVPSGDNTVVVISSNKMGNGDEVLGKLLMKGFIYALTQLPKLPKTVLLYNGGAHLSCEGSESLEDLKTLEGEGVEILTCGTCLNHYGITEKLAVGRVTNMYEIVEKQADAVKIIRP